MDMFGATNGLLLKHVGTIRMCMDACKANKIPCSLSEADGMAYRIRAMMSQLRAAKKHGYKVTTRYVLLKGIFPLIDLNGATVPLPASSVLTDGDVTEDDVP